MEQKTIFSTIWPPKEGEYRHTIVFHHRDGRTVRYEHGPCSENEASKALLTKRGNISGTVESIHWWEAFPDEDICKGCVAIAEMGHINPAGKTTGGWSTTHPQFAFGVYPGYCPKCREREIAALWREHNRNLDMLLSKGNRLS